MKKSVVKFILVGIFLLSSNVLIQAQSGLEKSYILNKIQRDSISIQVAGLPVDDNVIMEEVYDQIQKSKTIYDRKKTKIMNSSASEESKTTLKTLLKEEISERKEHFLKIINVISKANNIVVHETKDYGYCIKKTNSKNSSLVYIVRASFMTINELINE